MTAFKDFIKGFVIMIIFALVGLMVLFSNGLIIDYIMDAFLAAGVDAGAGTAWDNNGNVNFIINLSYYIGLAIIAIGIIQFFITIVNVSRYDEEYDVEYPELDYEF